jgi:cytochrome P450
MTQDTAVLEADAIIGQLMSPVALENPYPMYDRLRELAPNHVSAVGVRFVSTHDLCGELLKSRDFGQSFGLGSEGRDAESAFLTTIKESLILSDPPRHTRLRKLVNLAFSARMIKELGPRIQERIDSLLDDMADTMDREGQADLVTSLAMPLPAMVLGEMLGARPEDRDRLREWEEAIANVVKPVLDEELLLQADWATKELHSYIRELIDERRRTPGTDIISVLAKIESEGETLTESELVNVVFTIMAAGSQTTTATLSTMTYLLLRNRADWSRLSEDHALIPNALDEVMRYEAPVQNSFMRVAVRETVLGGQKVEEGEHVVGLLAAANRDPKAFTDPDQLVLDRGELGKSLAFGSGIHSCLGRALGRQQVIQGVESILRRFPDLALSEQEITWRRLLPVRQLDRLYVETTATGRQ